MTQSTRSISLMLSG